MSWSIVEATEVDLTFQMLFEEIKSGKFDCILQSNGRVREGDFLT